MTRNQQIEQEMAGMGKTKKSIRPFILLAVISLLFQSSLSLPLVEAASKRVTVYVITKSTTNNYPTKYTYTSDGLVRKAGDRETYTYREDGWPDTLTIQNTTSRFQYNTEGRLKRIKNYMELRYDKTGRINQMFAPGWFAKYAYNDKGYISYVYETGDAHIYYTYDENGNRSERAMDAPGTNGLKKDTVWEYTYTNGRVQSIKETFTSSLNGGGSDSTVSNTSFTYKKMSVPRKFLKYIRYQQWYIVNEIGPGIGVYLNFSGNVPAVSGETASTNPTPGTIQQPTNTATANITVPGATTASEKMTSAQAKQILANADIKVNRIEWVGQGGVIFYYSNQKNGQVDGYEIQYSMGQDFVNGQTQSLFSETTTARTTGIVVNVNYFVRVRAYIDTDTGRVWSAWGHDRMFSREW